MTTVATLMASLRIEYEATSLTRRRDLVAEAVGGLRQIFGGHEGECIAFISKAFDLDPIDDPVRVRLVASGVPFGGLTGDGPDERPVCFESVQDNAGSLLVEMVLHEAVHALTLQATKRDDIPISLLRTELSKRNVLDDLDLGQLWHVPYFVTAAATVQRFIDTAHIACGDASGYYARVLQSAAIAIPRWAEVVAGQTSGSEAVAQILAALDG